MPDIAAIQLTSLAFPLADLTFIHDSPPFFLHATLEKAIRNPPFILSSYHALALSLSSSCHLHPRHLLLISRHFVSFGATTKATSISFCLLSSTQTHSYFDTVHRPALPLFYDDGVDMVT